MKIPVGRSGTRIRIRFRAGDGSLEIGRAYVGRAAANGQFVGSPIRLSFDGQPSVEISQARGVATSDPVPLEVGFHDELYVSVSLNGEAAASAIDNFPDSYCYPGEQAGAATPKGASACPVAMAIQTVETETAPGRELVALGDSITEEYVEEPPDYRRSWPAVLEGLLGAPVLNSAVSGQGVDGPLLNLENDVSSLTGLTDCVVLLGTNDLCSYPTEKLETHLTMLFDTLRPYCRVWTATMTPREKESYCAIDAAQEELREVNAWLLSRGQDPVIDLNAATRDPAHPDSWRPEFEGDGVHPNYVGAAAMAAEAARVISSQK